MEELGLLPRISLASCLMAASKDENEFWMKWHTFTTINWMGATGFRFLASTPPASPMLVLAGVAVTLPEN